MRYRQRRSAGPRFTLFALLLTALIIAACGGDDAPEAPAATSTQAATPTAAADPTAEPEATSDAQIIDPPASTRPLLGTRTGLVTTLRDPAFEALPGATATFGQLGDATYRIEMPDEWNGDLVMWAHGFRGFGTEVYVSSPPSELRQAFIEQGYAWAASSYSENAYTPGIGADDTVALKDFFVQQFGEPGLTYLAGESMGGNVVTLSLEHFADDYDGALATCGALAGIEEIDYLISWTMVAEYTSGIEIPVGSDTTTVGSVLLSEVSPALGNPRNPTPRGEQFISIIKLLTGGDRPFFLEGLDLQYIDNFGLILLDPTRSSTAGAAGTNAEAVYAIEDGFGVTADEVNLGVRRLASDPAARDGAAHPDAVPTTGRIADPLLTLNATGDLFVPISQAVSYQLKANAAGTSDLLVQRAIRTPGHCTFSDEEMVTAWNDLVGWVTEGERPAGDDLLGDLSDIGIEFTRPLREGDPALTAARIVATVYAALTARTV